MKLPTKEACYKLFVKYKTPEPIIRHVEAVTRVAVIIATALKKKGVAVNVEAVERASLLHDLLRPVDFKDLSTFDAATADFYRLLRTRYGPGHAEASARAVAEEGFPGIASIMEKHGFMSIGTMEGPRTVEEKIVYYADKRVAHETIVSLKERLSDLHKRSGPHNIQGFSGKLREEKERLLFALQDELFSPLALKPGDIT